MALCRITGNLQLPDGDNAAGRVIVFYRSPETVATQSGAGIIPDATPIRVGQDGTVDFTLYTANYIGVVKLQRDGNEVHFRFPVPEAATANFQDILQSVDPVEPLPSWLQEAFDARDAAVAAAEAANKAPSSWADFQADEFLDMLDGAVVQFNGVQFVRDRGADVIGLMAGTGWRPHGSIKLSHFTDGSVANAAAIVQSWAYSSASGMAMAWDGEVVDLASDVRVDGLPNIKNTVVGAPPTFVLSSYTHGAFSIGRTCPGFSWAGDLHVTFQGVRVKGSGRWGGYNAFQRNVAFWVEASDFKHSGTLYTHNLSNSVCMRGPVQLRDGSYMAWANYATSPVASMSGLENMTGFEFGDIVADGQDFALMGIQHAGSRIKSVTLTGQTRIEEIDPHAVYITDSTNQAYEFRAVCRDLRIDVVRASDNPYSMPFKIRDTQGASIGTVYAYTSAGAVLIGERCDLIDIGDVISIDQVDEAALPATPASTTVDMTSAGGRATVGRIVSYGKAGSQIKPIHVRNGGTLRVGSLVSIQPVNNARANYFGIADVNSTLQIGSAILERWLPSGGTATTTIDALFHAMAGSSLTVDDVKYTGSAYYIRTVRQRTTGKAAISCDSGAVDGFFVRHPVEADTPGLVRMLSKDQTVRFFNNRFSDAVLASVRTTDGLAAPITILGDGIASPVYVPELTSGLSFSGQVVARQSSGSNNFAVWDVKGILLKGTNAAATSVAGVTVTLSSSTSGASAWAAPDVGVDTVAGGMTLTSGAVTGTIDWSAKIEFLGST